MKQLPTYKELSEKGKELENIYSTLENILDLANNGFHDGRGGDYEASASCCLDIEILVKECLYNKIR